ncbi:hypothetical protein [Plantactinospora sp. GCM10030261]|uniref:hypothetical protein n=1 Tax=Plantactinospora sp. GCM10030261 TaxID=3273420 RepID=UPI00361E1F9B
MDHRERPPAGSPPRLVAAASALLALLVAAVGGWWLARPASYPFGPADPVTVSVTHLIGPRSGGVLLLVAAAAGLAAAGLAATGRRPGAATTWIAGALVAAEAVFFGGVMADVTMLVGLAYGLALTSPLTVLATVAVACVRRERAGYLAAATLVALAAAGIGTGFLTAGSMTRFARNVLRGFAAYDERMAWGLAMAAVAAGWALLTYQLLRRAVPWHGAGRLPRGLTPAGARGWGRIVTVAAALCPLPYGLVRLTWLTPWPVGLLASEDNPAVRMQGAGLGLAAVGGSLLTLGLIMRWGEVFPSWVPMVGGRAVPVKLAVIPGGLVAAAVCVAAPGFVVASVQSDGMGVGLALALLLFPFPVWGPLLAAAVFAYRLRRGTASRAGHAATAPRPAWSTRRSKLT